MKPQGTMTAKEGWKDLRRRLPSMNRAYVRQRALRWSVLGLLTIIGSIGIAFVGGQFRWPDGSKSSVLRTGHAIKVKPNEPSAGPEGSPDGASQVEAAEQARK